MVRGSWRPNRNCNILTPLLWPSALCLSRSPDAQPEAWGLTLLAFFTTSYQQLLWTPTHQGPKGPLRRAFSTTSCLLTRLISNSSGAPRAPSAWCGFPYHISSKSKWSLTVLTELYNSSTPTQSPTQSLEWHVWSSSSGNNCHAVHRSLSSGAVYKCIMGFFPCPILLARSTYAIFPHKFHRNVSLPSGASLCNGKFGRVEGQNTTQITSCHMMEFKKKVNGVLWFKKRICDVLLLWVFRKMGANL